jgi:hypothetical protein
LNWCRRRSPFWLSKRCRCESRTGGLVRLQPSCSLKSTTPRGRPPGLLPMGESEGVSLSREVGTRLHPLKPRGKKRNDSTLWAQCKTLIRDPAGSFRRRANQNFGANNRGVHQSAEEDVRFSTAGGTLNLLLPSRHRRRRPSFVVFQVSFLSLNSEEVASARAGHGEGHTAQSLNSAAPTIATPHPLDSLVSPGRRPFNWDSCGDRRICSFGSGLPIPGSTQNSQRRIPRPPPPRLSRASSTSRHNIVKFAEPDPTSRFPRPTTTALCAPQQSQRARRRTRRTGCTAVQLACFHPTRSAQTLPLTQTLSQGLTPSMPPPLTTPR